MRYAPLLLTMIGMLCGCMAKQGPHLTATPKTLVTQVDSIDALVDRLSASHGAWGNRIFPTLGLPTSASTEQVVARVFEMVGFEKGRVTTHRILETRQVRIDNGVPGTIYTAVLVDTSLGHKIVLLRYLSPSLGWWSAVYVEQPST